MPHIKSEKIKWINWDDNCEHTIQVDYSTVSDSVEVIRQHTDGNCGVSGAFLGEYEETQYLSVHEAIALYKALGQALRGEV